MKKNTYSNKNFSFSMLPKNRKEQFGDLFKNRFTTILSIAGVSLLFSIPFLVSVIFRIYFLSNAAGLNEQDVSYGVNIVNVFFDCTCFITIPTLFICYSGLINIIKKMTYGEGVFFWHDFAEGVKNNWKYFLITSFIYCGFHIIDDTVVMLLNNQFYSYIPKMIEFVIILPIVLFIISMSSTYNFKNYGHCIKNSFALAFDKYFISLAFSLAFIALNFVYYLVFIPLIALLVYALFFLIIIPVIIIAFYLFSTSRFDKIINATDNKEFFHKGLMDEQGIKETKTLKEKLSELNFSIRDDIDKK